MIINRKHISSTSSPYIVAELSANHGQDIKIALESIKSARNCGANAIKIQTYTADSMTFKRDNKIVIENGIWKGNDLYNLYKKAQTPYIWHKKLFQYAKKLGITIFSSPFDEESVDLLAKLNCPAYKIASFEIVDIPLIKYVAKRNKPIIISTGNANYEEIYAAVEAAKTSNGGVALLHCISSYPASPDKFNLKTINFLKKEFNLPIGLSDHSIGINVAISAIALGACIIEKHFILNKKIKSPDSKFSMLPKEFNELCSTSKIVWKSIGKKDLRVNHEEKQNLIFRRSLYFKKDMNKGEIINEDSISRKRPNIGLSPIYYDQIIGKKVTKNIKKNTPIKKNLVKF